MKKTLMACGVGLALVASQAMAQTSAAPRVADRLGAPAGESDQLAGMPASLIFAAVAVAGFVILHEATTDDSESD